MIRLWYARLCPFAQRPCAVLERLGIRWEGVEVALGARPPELLERTPTGSVPLLEDDGLVLYESIDIVEYLADVHGWEAAYSADPRSRARERLAVRRWDAVVVPAWKRSMRSGRIDAAGEALDAEIAEMAETFGEGRLSPDSAPGHCLATHWARMRLLADRSPVADRIEHRAAELAGWLDRAANLVAVRRTSPDPAEVRETVLRRLSPAG